jgi:hypothetical protein
MKSCLKLNGNNNYFLYLIIIFSAGLSCSLTPLIPTNNGLGFDGSIYYGILQSFCKGEIGRGGEPYYFMRIGSIIHLIPVELYFKNTLTTLGVARIFSSLFAISGVFLAVISSLSNFGPKRLYNVPHILIFLSSIFTFAVFTMPAFYPILSDHIALFISGLSLYVWRAENSFRNEMILIILTFISFFVMPGLFLIPFFLLSFPQQSAVYDGKCATSKFTKFLYLLSNTKQFFLIVSFFLSLIAIIFFYASCSAFVFTNAPARKFSVSSGLPELRYISTLFVLLFTGIFPFLFLNRFRNVIAFCNLTNLILGIMSIIAFVIIYIEFAATNAGFKGPNLLFNLTQQAISFPLSSLPAIFSYFGPIGMIGLYIALFGRITSLKSKNTDTVASLCLIFCFFLLIGNESRSYICVFPLLVYLVCVTLNSIKILPLLIYVLIFSIAILAIGQPIGANTNLAVSQNMGPMEWPWQSYFGRIGPWMSMTSRLLWTSLLSLFLIGLFIFRDVKLPYRSSKEK